ncbi:MAG: hypothetical protein ABGW84_08640 [Sphingomonadaceae bacterium]
MKNTRSLVGFVDLTLILLGSLALVGDLERRDEESAAGPALEPVAEPGSEYVLRRPIAQVFEPGEARLAPEGRAWLARLVEDARIGVVRVSVAPDASDGAGRLDEWEIAAARTASILYALKQAGVSDERIDPQLPRDGSEAGLVTITIAAGAPRD